MDKTNLPREIVDHFLESLNIVRSPLVDALAGLVEDSLSHSSIENNYVILVPYSYRWNFDNVLLRLLNIINLINNNIPSPTVFRDLYSKFLTSVATVYGKRLRRSVTVESRGNTDARGKPYPLVIRLK